MSQAISTAAAPARLPEIKYREMAGVSKFGFVIKVCTFFITFGFAYPNILVD
jgi:hypothetical protein